MVTASDCCLCSQIEGRKDNDLIAQLLPGAPYARRIMLQSPSFAVMPSLGALVKGHSLLCPRAHIRSFALLDQKLDAEYRDFKARLRQYLLEIHGLPVALFEHGMAATGDRILCTVEHAHIHFLPLPRDFDSNVRDGERWVEFDGSLASLRRLSQEKEYIYYETPNGRSRLLTCAGTAMESQYMRKVVAASLGAAAEWDWRKTPDPVTADETWRQFVRHLDGA